MDNKSKALGYLVGKQIAGMRRVTAEPVAWLYNGVRLPKLPEWDREAYPYALISYFSATDEDDYSLVVSAEPLIPTGDLLMPFTVKAPRLRCTIEDNNDSWGDVIEYLDKDTVITSLSRPIWSNVAITKYNGALYIAASEPVPVYE